MQRQINLFNFRRAFFFLVTAILLGPVFISNALAFGPTQCPGDRFGSDLVCTAGDVSITGLTIRGGSPSCVGGTSAMFDLDLTINSAVPDRFDIGIFISNDGSDPQLTQASGGPASCSVDILPPNDPPFRNLDPGPWSGTTDVCGDVNGTMNGGAGTGLHTMTGVSVACQTTSGSGGKLQIPFVVSWDNSPTSNPLQEGLCTSSDDVVPNTKSKCNSPTILQRTVDVVVLPSISKTDNSATIFADGITIYTVVITNTTGDTLSNAVFTDPAVTDLTVNSVVCTDAGGATCPTTTIAAMQGAGITIPAMPVDSSVTFTINAELDEDATGVLTNIAYVTVGGQTNSDSDVDTILDPDVVPTISKTDGATTIAPGFSTTYTVVITNTTDDPLSNAVFADPAVTDLTVNSVICSPAGGATCPAVSIAAMQGAGITIPVMPDNSSVTFSINATLAPTASGVLTNTASVTAGGQTNLASDINTIQAGPALKTCGPIPATYPVYSVSQDLDIDDGVTIDVGSGQVGVEKGKNNGNAIDTVTTVGDVITATQTLPTLEPVSFPATGSLDLDITGTQTIDSADNPPGDASYDVIDVMNNAMLTFTGGGPFYIDRLRARDTTTITFNAGIYFIDQLDVTNDDVTIIVNGAVRLFIGDRFTTGNNDDNLSVNAGGNVSDLVVFLYPNAEFDMRGKNLDFTGVIYGPQSGDIRIDDNSTIKGAIIGGADIDIKDNVDFLYDSTVASDVASITTCLVSFSHYVISHDSFGINCVAESITVSSIGTDGQPYNAGGQPIVLNTQTGSGTWSSTAGNSGSFADVIADDGFATYTFAVGETSASFLLDYTTGTNNTLNIAVTDGVTILDDDSEGNLVFSPNGFTVTSTALANPFDGVIPLSFPSQVAGTNVPVYITAYGQTPADPTCGVIEAYDGNRPLRFWFDYSNPINDSGVNPTINGAGITDNGEANALLATTTFTQGRTQVTLKYKDVGEITLGIKDTTAHPDLPTGIRGTANIIFRPADIIIDAVTRADGSGDYLNVAGDTTAPVLAAAGNDFGVRVRVVDAEGDVTPNYGYETAVEGISIASTTLVAPSPGVNGTISNATGFGRTDIDGVTTLADGYFAGTNFSFDEVGIIKLTATVADGDYLGTGLAAAANTESTNVGRFNPASYTVTGATVTPALNAAGCGAGQTVEYTYSRQPFTATLNIEAHNAAGDVTLNYRDTFATLDINDPAELPLSHDQAMPAGNPYDMQTAAFVTGSSFSDTTGVASIDLLLRWDMAEQVATTSILQIATSSADDGGIPIVADAIAMPPIDLNNLGSTEVRYGRLALSNAFGSELIPLAIPLQVEEVKSDGVGGLFFGVASDDNCTTYDGTNPANMLGSYTGNLNDPETALSGASTVSNGDQDSTNPLTLSPPGVGNDGSVVITLDVPAWLKYDWNGGGNENPTGTATFGIFNGRESTIYIREVY